MDSVDEMVLNQWSGHVIILKLTDTGLGSNEL